MERRLAAILAADVVGYSRLMEADEEATARTLSTYREIIVGLVASHHGRVFGSAGDSVIAEFARPVEAVRCAVDIQRKLEAQNVDLPKDRRMRLRIGINLGDVMVEGDNLLGDAVNIAARLEALAEPGGISLARSVFDQVKKQLDLGYEYLGEHEVKNIAEPVPVYRVLTGPEAAGKIIGETKRVTQSWKRVTLAAAAIVLIGVAGAVTWLRPWEPTVEPVSLERMAFPLPDKPSIAVLPFDNLSANPEEGYFADGLTDDLITDLSKVSGLFVIARNSVFIYKDQAVDIREVARELGVRYVLEGSVRRAGDNVRINAQLVDATTGGHIWAERFDRQYTDIFALQDEVIEHIVEALSVELSEAEKIEVARLPTESLEAYDYYLRGEELAYRAEPESAVDALALYEKAIALDPEFANAYAGYARVATDVLAYSFANTLPSAVARKRAYEATGRALALNPQLSRGYSVLALLQMLDSAHGEATASARKAVALSPNSAEAYLNLAVVLVFAGAPEEALQAMETVLKLDPKPPRHVHDYHGFVLYMNRRYAEAIEVLEKGEITAKSDFGLETLAAANARMGRMGVARDAIETLLERWPGHSLASVRVAYAHHAREEDLAHRFDALRLAGLPEWPYGIQGDPEYRLEGDAIDALTFGRTWIGERTGFGPFMQYVDAKGAFIERGPNHRLAGTASRKGDLLCLETPGVLLGRPHCGPIYRNPTGTSESQDEYLYLNAYLAKRFTATP